MTSEELKTAQATLGLTNPQMAELLQCDISHVENMRGGRKSIRGSYARIIEQALELNGCRVR